MAKIKNVCYGMPMDRGAHISLSIFLFFASHSDAAKLFVMWIANVCMCKERMMKKEWEREKKNPFEPSSVADSKNHNKPVLEFNM